MDTPKPRKPLQLHDTDSEPSSAESDVEVLDPAWRRAARMSAASGPRSSRGGRRRASRKDDDLALAVSGLSIVPAQREREQRFFDDPKDPVVCRPAFQPYPVGERGPAATKAWLAELIRNVPAHKPLPRQPFSFVPDEHSGTAHPTDNEDVLDMLGSTLEEQQEWEKVVDGKWQTARLMPGEQAPWRWEQIEAFKLSAEGLHSRVARQVCFFPFVEVPGCEQLATMFALVQNEIVSLGRIGDSSHAASSGGETEPKSTVARLATLGLAATEQRQPKTGKNVPEDLHACVWGLDSRYTPPIPLILVGGVGKLVHMIQVLRKSPARPESFGLHLERSISGQGGTIWDLATLPKHPNLVIAAGEDCAPALYDATVAGGSNDEVRWKHHQLTSQGKRSSAGTFARGSPVVRPAVPGELVAKVDGQGNGHTRGVLSVAVHPNGELVVTGGQDGRVCGWKLSIWEERNGKVEAEHKLLFRSHRVHSGQWVSQVAWADPKTASIVSKSAASNADSPRYRSKTVLHWTPDILDKDPATCPDPVAVLPPNGELAYHLEQRAEWPDQDVFGDHFGVCHTYSGALGEAFVAVPIGPRPRLNGEVEAPAVAVLAPQSARREVVPTGKLAETVEGWTGCVFPTDRERPLYDHTPRWRVEDWVEPKLGEGEGQGSVSRKAARKGLTGGRTRRQGSEGGSDGVGRIGEGVRLRAVGVSADGRWMVGVGDRGAVVVWRRVQRKVQSGVV